MLIVLPIIRLELQQYEGVPEHFVHRALHALITGAPNDCKAACRLRPCGPGATVGWEGHHNFSCVSFLCASFLPAALRAGASAHGVRLAFVMAPSCAGWADSLALLIVVLILEGA